MARAPGDERLPKSPKSSTTTDDGTASVASAMPREPAKATAATKEPPKRAPKKHPPRDPNRDGEGREEFGVESGADNRGASSSRASSTGSAEDLEFEAYEQHQQPRRLRRNDSRDSIAPSTNSRFVPPPYASKKRRGNLNSQAEGAAGSLGFTVLPAGDRAKESDFARQLSDIQEEFTEASRSNDSDSNQKPPLPLPLSRNRQEQFRRRREARKQQRTQYDSDSLGAETSLVAFGDEAPARTPKVRGDKEWEAIKQRIIALAPKLGLDPSDQGQTITLSHKKDDERISVTRQEDNHLRLVSKANTPVEHLVQVFIATGRSRCKVNKTENAAVAAALYEGLSAHKPKIQIKLSDPVVAQLNASADPNHKRIAEKYLRENPSQDQPTRSAPGTPSPAPRQEAQRRQKPQPNPAGLRNRPHVEEPAPESSRSQELANGNQGPNPRPVDSETPRGEFEDQTPVSDAESPRKKGFTPR
jgi:hypothetical protein